MPLKYPLREFAFFDKRKVVDFVSAIEDGLRQGSRESLRTQSRGATGGVGVEGIAHLQVSKGTTKREFEETRTPTDASVFERLHSYLEGQGILKDAASPDLAELDLVEPVVDVELSGKEVFLELAESMKQFAPVFPSGAIRDQPHALDLLATLSQSAANQGITLVMTPSNNTRFKLVTTLPYDPERLRVTRQELRGKYHVLCRVLRVLKPDEQINLFDVIRGVKVPTEQLETMIRTQPEMFSHRMTKENLFISFPGAEVSTIALFR